jgi:hypothetical protein
MLLSITKTNLEQVEKSPTVKGLTENNFELVRHCGNSVAAILDRPNLIMLKKVVDPTLLELFLATELTLLIDSVNLDQRLTIQGHQIPIIAAQLIESFPVETLEDFVLCFKRGSIGFYGSIYRLDAAVINEWMRAYLEEKYTLVEAEVSKSKTKEQQAATVDYLAYIERKDKERQQAIEKPKAPDNWNTNELERFKLEYQTRTIFQKKLHRASSEYYSGKPKDEIKVWEDGNGFEIFAVTEQEGKEIYDQVVSSLSDKEKSK